MQLIGWANRATKPSHQTEPPNRVMVRSDAGGDHSWRRPKAMSSRDRDPPPPRFARGRPLPAVEAATEAKAAAPIGPFDVRRVDGTEDARVALEAEMGASEVLGWPRVPVVAPSVIFAAHQHGRILAVARMRVLDPHDAEAWGFEPRPHRQAVVERLVVRPHLSRPGPVLFRMLERMTAESVIQRAALLLASSGDASFSFMTSLGFRPAAPSSWTKVGSTTLELSLGLSEGDGPLDKVVARVRRVAEI